MAKISEALDKIKESPAFTQLRTKYDELDARNKLILNWVIVIGSSVLFLSVISWGLSSSATKRLLLEDRTLLIQTLQQSADEIQQFKTQQMNSRNSDKNTPLTQWVMQIATDQGLDPATIQASNEKTNESNKDYIEESLEFKIQQTNLRILHSFLFQLTDRGNLRNLQINGLNVDANPEFGGYMNAILKITGYRAK